jgi:hypothetical protein
MFSRYTHNEFPPHKWGISWTTSRTLPSDMGNHFYLAKYRVLIKNSKNTLIIWKPTDWHGTTLALTALRERPGTLGGDPYQSGLSFIASDKLKTSIDRVVSVHGLDAGQFIKEKMVKKLILQEMIEYDYEGKGVVNFDHDWEE